MKQSILALALVAGFASMAAAAEETQDTQAATAEEQKAEASAEAVPAEEGK